MLLLARPRQLPVTAEMRLHSSYESGATSRYGHARVPGGREGWWALAYTDTDIDACAREQGLIASSDTDDFGYSRRGDVTQ